MRLSLCCFVVSMTALATREAGAVERQWHAGVDAGWYLGGFPEGSVNGFGGGVHLAYGISDAFNLRLHADVAPFDLPEPATSALMHGAFFGAEYVFDILDWVPYIGVAPGAVLVSRRPGSEDPGGDRWHLGIEVPIGLGYQLSHHIAFLAEWRLRALLLGDERTPVSNSLVMGRFELMWDM
jgi:hypothetical protein